MTAEMQKNLSIAACYLGCVQAPALRSSAAPGVQQPSSTGAAVMQVMTFAAARSVLSRVFGTRRAAQARLALCLLVSYRPLAQAACKTLASKQLLNEQLALSQMRIVYSKLMSE